MKYSKGSTIATWDCYAIVPLFDWDDDDDRQKSSAFHRLPRFSSMYVLPELYSFDRFIKGSLQFNDSDHENKIMELKIFLRMMIDRLDSSDSYFIAAIVASLCLITVDIESTLEWVKNTSTKESAAVEVDNDDSNNNSGNDYFPTSLLRQSWKLVDGPISIIDWKHLLLAVLQSMHIVSREHPLIAYSQQCIPYMSTSELDEVVALLQLPTDSRSSIAIQYLVQEFCSGREVPTFVVVPLPPNMKQLSDDNSSTIVSPPITITALKHSCLPTTQLELDFNVGGATVSLKALYDIASHDDVSISYIRGHDDGIPLEQRDRILQYRIGQSCCCVRCRYELQVESSCYTLADLSVNDLTRIGHYFMMKEEFDEAKQACQEVLNKALSMTNQDLIVVDIYHSLGAIELNLGNFLDAQRIWNKANNEFPKLCSSHEGIALQLEKIKCYAYLNDESLQLIPNPLWKCESPVPNCFVTPILDDDMCQTIIRWAEELGTWTRKRHYAVPSYDVPVHTVPPLLDWFQNKFMNPIIQHLLLEQFKIPSKNGRFYVHDAFVVRYESSDVSNHLPIHTDESTHSLVVVLNDDYEGGGTYLSEYDLVVRPSKGSVVSFRGDVIPHGGQAVTMGVRYILAVFLYFDVPNGSHKRSAKEPSTTKRNSTELHGPLRQSKEQKVDFSFNFQC